MSGESPWIKNGGASAYGELRYFFAIHNPFGVSPDPFLEIPIVVASRMRLLAQVDDYEKNHIILQSQVRMGKVDLDSGKFSNSSVGFLNAITPDNGDGYILEDELYVGVHGYPPFSVGMIQISVSAGMFCGTDSQFRGGYFSGYIDPIIQVDPDFMIEIDGQMTPGSEAFPITFSEGIVQVPEPSSAVLVLTLLPATLLATGRCVRRRRVGKGVMREF